MPREDGNVGIVEYQRVGRSVGPGERSVQPVAKLHGHQRIHAQIEESHRRRRRRRQPQNGLDLPLQEFHEQVLVPGRGRMAQKRENVVCLRRIAGFRIRVGDHQVLQKRRPIVHGVFIDVPVHGGHHGRADVLANQPFERAKTLLRLDPAGSGCFQLSRDSLALLLGFAEPGPCAPGDGLPRQPERAAVGGELIEKCVGCRVVCLTGVSENAGHARKQHEHVQVQVLGRPMQMPGSQDFRPEHLLKPVPVLVPQSAVCEHAHAVDHAGEGSELPVHAFEHRVQGARVGHVGEFHADVHAPVPERVDLGLHRFVRHAPSVQHDGPGSAVGEPAGHDATDAAQTARHQVGAVLPQMTPGQRRIRQHDLAQMPGGAHEAHRARRLRQ